MFSGLFGKRPTTKSDVILAIAGAVIGLWKAVDTYNEYKIEQEKKEITQ